MPELPRNGTAIDGHLCKPTALAGHLRAADVPPHTRVACGCGKVWQVTHSRVPAGMVHGWKRVA